MRYLMCLVSLGLAGLCCDVTLAAPRDKNEKAIVAYVATQQDPAIALRAARTR